MERRERIHTIITSKGLNKNSFSAAIGMDNNVTIGRIINEKRNPSAATCKKIIDSFPQYNPDWILEGTGDMLLDIQHTISDITPNTTSIKPYTTYLLPMSAMGGSLGGFSADSAMLHNCEAIVSPIENVDFAITVYGESMSPEYPSGSRVLIKQINPDIFIDWGKVYVLDTANGVIVKEIHESEIEGHVKCHSINPDPKFKPFNVPCSEVYNWYRVLMCLSIK